MSEDQIDGFVKINQDSYEAFRASENGDTSIVKIPVVDNLKDAIAAALSEGFFVHKDKLIIREILPQRNRVRLVAKRNLHIYAIRKKSSPTYRYDRETHTEKRIHQLYENHIATIDERVLDGEGEHSGVIS